MEMVSARLCIVHIWTPTKPKGREEAIIQCYLTKRKMHRERGLKMYKKYKTYRVSD